ncbi:MAG: branched-chain amino acid ABC transporter permease [Nocardioides sp.]|uniref:branched-chain amino acid ABC transporter permease n=1 Tax=Nocardioides sp. TaxID=35761 RepID=UPI0039E32F18
MSTETSTSRRSLSLGTFGWPLGFAVLAVLAFIWYGFLLPDSGRGTQQWFQEWLPLGQLNYALIWAMSALGLNIVVGYAGLLDLGFVAFWALGGYCTAWLMSYFVPIKNVIIGGSPALDDVDQGIHLNIILVLIAAAALCALFGVIIGAPTLRLRGDYLALVTMGFGEIIPQVFKNGDKAGLGFNLSNATQGISPIDPVEGLSVRRGEVSWGPLTSADTVGKFLLFAILTALIVFVSLRIRRGRMGRAWLAIREDELAASAMGVPLTRVKLSAYAVGAMAGGLGGVAYAQHLSRMGPDKFNFGVSVILLAMVVLGGMGNVWGVLVGALGLAMFNSTWLPHGGDSINDTLGTSINFESLSFLIFGGALVLMMLFRREGFFPESRTRAVMHEGGPDDLMAEEPDEKLVESAEEASK